jgi:hypothetical protein
LNRRHESRCQLRYAVVLIAAIATAQLAGAAPAAADTAVLTVTTTTGQSDPAAGVPRIFTVSGSTSLPKQLFVKFRATGGAPCAPSASSDSGTYLGIAENFDGYAVNGAFSSQEVLTRSQPGDVLYCIWLADDRWAIATPIAQTVTFRAPTATVSGTVGPVTPRTRQLARVTIAGTSETPTSLFAKIRGAGGAPCAPTAASDTGSEPVDFDYINVNGAFSTTATVTQATAGSYLICLWLADSSSSVPIAGPQPVTFTVTAPPPPPPRCVVPVVRFNASLSKVKRRIRARHCSVGRVVRVRSRRVARGRVIRLKPRSRSRLAQGTPVTVVVSKGWPRRATRRHR